MNAVVHKIVDHELKSDWLRLRPLIVKAVKWTGAYDETHLLRGVVGGVFTFWPGKKAFIIASIDRYPLLTRLHLLLAGGDHNEVAKIEPAVVLWGRSLGATQSYTEARLGLDRLNEHSHGGYYADSGYQRSRVVYVKEI